MQSYIVKRRKHEVGPISGMGNSRRFDGSLGRVISSTSARLEINVDDEVGAVAFTEDGEHLVCGTLQGVRVWRVKDGKQVAMMVMEHAAWFVAASRDGRWIAAGTVNGEVFIWDATTYERVFADKIASDICQDVDFSPDSTQLVSADGEDHTTTIWDIQVAHQKVRTLDHNAEWVYLAKYSSQGDRIATATDESVRVWDSNDGRLLVDVKTGAYYGSGDLWCNNHLLVKTRDSTIKQINAATGLTVSEWPVPDTDGGSCVAASQRGNFMVYSTKKSITCWDTATRTQLSPIYHTREICSVACSADGQLLAISGEGRIVVKDPSSVVFCFISEPEIHIDSAALNAWKYSQLRDAEVLLSASIQTSEHTHHVLASRALVRARLGQRKSELALVDAEESIEIQQSAIGYIAKCPALVGKGEKDEAVRVCDMAFLHLPSDYVSLFLLIKAVVLFMAGEHVDAISRMNELVAGRWADPAFHVVQAYMHLLLGNLHMEGSSYEPAIQSFQDARTKLGNRTRHPPAVVSLISGWRFDDLAITIQQRLCEALFAADRTAQAAESVLRMMDNGINMTESIKTWISDFKDCCCRELEILAALLLRPASSQDLLMKRSNAWVANGAREEALDDVKEWVRLMLTSGAWKDALVPVVGFMLERLDVFRALCEHLETTGHITDAAACFHHLSTESGHEIDGAQASWIRDFKSRCYGKLEGLGDSAMCAQEYDEAISQYTAALSFDPPCPQHLLVKRSKSCAASGLWEDSLNDANEVIKLDPSSPLGYERKHQALCVARRYVDATDAFEMMLLKMSESLDPGIRERSRHYVRPEKTQETIRTAIKKAVCHSPPVLIDTNSGRLCNKLEQIAAFESTLTFTELICSMTTEINHALIEQVVGKFYRYAMLSHTWESGEPLYEGVVKIVVYDLKASQTHRKLQMFCKIVLEDGFNWAWSDTCCIDKGDHFVLQEALVRMFKWYEGSAMTLIFLCDADQLAELVTLMTSRWNSRGWTLQEYHASKVVRIYTKDWTLYPGLTVYNHKEAPEIISMMEKATGISAQALMALRPGLNGIREKLRLASTRQTTRVEDAAYSLLGIFSMSLPVTYGEEDKALGRLLSQLLMSSGDTSILVWIGVPGSFNSCLPTNIAVFSQPVTSHIPPAIPDIEMDTITAELRHSALDGNLVARLFDDVDKLPTVVFASQRMKLPCLAFKAKLVSGYFNGSEFVFGARTCTLGDVEFKTRQRLTSKDFVYLIHPWINFLLNRGASGNYALDEDGMPELSGSSPYHFTTSDEDSASVSSPSTTASMHVRLDIYRFLARLKQPFGALLLASTSRNAAEYRRIATESLITVQVKEITPATLDRLIRCVRVLDVL